MYKKERVTKMPAWGRTSKALAAAALAGVLFSPLAGAEEEVGLEAQGVSPWAALENRWGLDVRDELGRPVSARRIEAQLKKASARQSTEGRSARGQDIALTFELLAPLGTCLRALAEQFGLPRVSGLAPSSSRKAVLFLAVLAVLAAGLPLSAFAVFRCPAVSRSRLPLVLRC